MDTKKVSHSCRTHLQWSHTFAILLTVKNDCGCQQRQSLLYIYMSLCMCVREPPPSIVPFIIFGTNSPKLCLQTQKGTQHS